MTNFVRAAASPKGDRFLVTIAPPGSLLDANLASTVGGIVGVVLTIGGLIGSLHDGSWGVLGARSDYVAVKL